MLSRKLLALAFIGCMSGEHSYAAERIDLFKNKDILTQSSKSNASVLSTQPESLGKSLAANIENALISESNLTIEYLEANDTASGRSLVYEQFYRGIPIWKHNFVVVLNGNRIASAYGKIVSTMEGDIGNLEPLTDAEIDLALNKFIETHYAEPDRFFRDKSAEQSIYIDDNDKAFNAIKITFFTDLKRSGNRPEKVIAFIDVDTGNVLKKINALMYASQEKGSGPRGNEKFQKEDFRSTAAEEDTFLITKDNNNCAMDAFGVETRDAENKEEKADNAFEYSCNNDENKNTERWVNGGNAPMNDAHYHAQVTRRMFQSYLTNYPFKNKKIIQNVHYGNRFDNAFYENGQVFYGDGDYLFYPLTTLDVVAHEIAHGYTAKYGWGEERLLIEGKARAINESFSDMAAEAAEYYLTGQNDWKASRENYKIGSNDRALRYLDEPTKDGKSVDHIDNYNEGLGEHYNAGILSKVFYNLATNKSANLPGNDGPWNTKYAFMLFGISNHLCWYSDITFQGVANCAFTVLEDEGINFSRLISDDNPNSKKWSSIELKNQVRKAFAQTGIKIATNSGLESEFTYNAAMDVVSFKNNSRINGKYEFNSDFKFHWDFGDGNSSEEFEPIHTYAESGIYNVSLKVNNKDSSISDIFSIPVVVSKDYCSVSGTNFDKYFLKSVKINSHEETSGATQYSDFSDKTIVLTNNKLEIELVSGDHAETVDSYKTFEIWVDKDRDGKFVKEELLYSTRVKGSTKANIDFVGDADLPYRIRVLVSGISRNNIPCGSLSFAEIEDYTVQWSKSSSNIDYNIEVQKTSDETSVTFKNLTNDSRIKAWYWDFDTSDSNGNAQDTSRDKSPVFQYAKKGTYTIKLEALNSNNQVIGDPWTKTINIAPKTEALFSNKMDSDNNRKVIFDATASVYPINSELKWDFDNDGSFNDGNGEKPSYTFPNKNQTYTVTLKIINDDNKEGVTYIKKVFVGDLFMPSFHISSQQQDNGNYKVTFHNETTDPGIEGLQPWMTLEWDFGDSNSSTPWTNDIGQDTEHTYEKGGSYTASLRIKYYQWGNWEEKYSETFELTFTLKPAAPVEYCTPVDDTAYEHIDSVTINNKTFKNNADGGLVNEGDSITLYTNQDNQFEIRAAYKEAEISAENYHIWVDLNGNGVFETSPVNELIVNVLDHTTGSLGNGYVSGTFKLDSNLFSRSTTPSRIRIFQVYSGTRTTPMNAFDTCINYPDFYTSGEIEDYIVNIVK